MHGREKERVARLAGVALCLVCCGFLLLVAAQMPLSQALRWGAITPANPSNAPPRLLVGATSVLDLSTRLYCVAFTLANGKGEG